MKDLNKDALMLSSLLINGAGGFIFSKNVEAAKVLIVISLELMKKIIKTEVGANAIADEDAVELLNETYKAKFEPIMELVFEKVMALEKINNKNIIEICEELYEKLDVTKSVESKSATSKLN